MNSIFDWIWALLPLFFGTGLFFWVYNLQERIDNLERRFEEMNPNWPSQGQGD